MRDQPKKVGIGRLVRLAWLEETASLVAAGNDKDGVHDSLDQLLAGRISLGGNAPRSGREKAITVLMKTWLLVPDGLEPMRDDGLRLWSLAEPGERLAVHWGMLLAAYPFWGAVAASTGRLLRVQGQTAPAQVQQRIRAEYGERPGVARAARYVLRSFVDWGVLTEAERVGAYSPAPRITIRNRELVGWLAEAVLRSRALPAAPPRAVLTGPRLFPFLPVLLTGDDLAAQTPRLDFVRHGLDQELVMLRRDVSELRNDKSQHRLLFARSGDPEPT